MSHGRLEAFSDGVIAIIITIMVLHISVPNGDSLASILTLIPNLLAYALSFAYLAIYWNNHHHMFQLVRETNGRILWANLYLLFWLSLIPFGTDWIGQAGLTQMPTLVYGVILAMAGIAFYILQRVIIVSQGPQSVLKSAVGRDWKSRSSIVLYLSALPMAFVLPFYSIAIYVLVALLWIVPDRRIEKLFKS